MSKILITGASGRVCQGLLKRLDKIFNPGDIIYLLRHSNPINFQNIGNLRIEETAGLNDRYDFAMHFAATTDTKRCKEPSYREEARRANVDLTKRVCDASDKVLFSSSIHVFKGDSDEPYKETDETNPCDFYGETKAEAENITKENERNAVIRLGQTIGVKSRIVDKSIVEAIQTGDYSPYRTNVTKQMSDIRDIIETIKIIYLTDRNGIYHIGCEGHAPSQAEIADFVLGFWKSKGWERKVEYFEKESCEDPKIPKRLVFDTEFTQKELGMTFHEAENALVYHLNLRSPSSV